MKKKTKQQKQNITEEVTTYSYDSLVNSKRYEEHNWAARAALKKDQRYTLDQSDKALSDYLKKRVVI